MQVKVIIGTIAFMLVMIILGVIAEDNFLKGKLIAESTPKADVIVKGKRIGTTPLEHALVAGTYELTMAEYLDAEGFCSPLLRGYVDSRLTDEYGCLATEISAYAALLFWAATGGETEVITVEDALERVRTAVHSFGGGGSGHSAL